VGSGTSYAAPMVATAVAVLKSVNPKLKPAAIESILKSTAKDLGGKGKDDNFGYGLIDLEKAIKQAMATK
jgi:thermitase